MRSPPSSPEPDGPFWYSNGLRCTGTKCEARSSTWGVAEAQRLGIYETLMRSGGIHHSRSVPYDETVEPAEAEAAALPLDSLLPGVPGTLGVGHPRACEALSQAAIANGARVLRGVESPEAQLGHPPTVRYLLNGAVYVAKCRLVIGADGRESAIRRRAGITLHVTQPRLLMAGMLVDELDSWPEHYMTIGTEGDRVFFVVPQGAGRVRLYLLWSCDHRHRFAGSGGPRAFLDSFALACIPKRDCIVRARPAGPCATYPMNDSWTDNPIIEGLALIGDAAGYSDPHIGQGLSVALRDVRVLSELLATSEDWSPNALKPYTAERAERMRRMRFCNAVATTLRGESVPRRENGAGGHTDLCRPNRPSACGFARTWPVRNRCQRRPSTHRYFTDSVHGPSGREADCRWTARGPDAAPSPKDA